MTKGGFFAGGIAAFLGLIVLFFAGLVALLIFAAWAFIAAIVGHLALATIDREERSVKETGCVVPFMVAFMVSGAAAFALDLVFETYISLPAMIDAVDRLTVAEHARYEPLIQSVRDYYALALGPTPGTWLRFAGYYVVIVLVFAAVLLWFSLNLEPEHELYPEPVSPMQRTVRRVGASAVAVVAVALTLFPLSTWAAISLRNLSR